jgi:hypothetical protein
MHLRHVPSDWVLEVVPLGRFVEKTARHLREWAERQGYAVEPEVTIEEPPPKVSTKKRP